MRDDVLVDFDHDGRVIFFPFFFRQSFPNDERWGGGALQD